ncbi:MAG: RraA family protein [Betaproteobacteria bacterium]|nr:RraA family protein [Betaproteobacteria bacterium]
MDVQALFAEIGRFDTPTICNALEIVRGARFTRGFTRRQLVAAFPDRPAIVGFARTAMIRCSVPYDSAERKRRQLQYYEYIAGPDRPSVAVVQDIDGEPGLGAFWGEVNTTVHRGLGCVGAVTNGSMRDLDAMHPEFQCIASTLSPSHAWVQVVDVGVPVDIHGMLVRSGDIVHADRHGAVVFTRDELGGLPAAIDLMARREKEILDAARSSDFGFEKLRDALAAAERVR